MESLESLGIVGFSRRIVYDSPGEDWDLNWSRYCERGRGSRVDWTIPVYSGLVLAHLAAEAGRLPPDFQLWDLKDYRGWSVAHICARKGTLPEDFDMWDLADYSGWTVGHVYVTYRTPQNFTSKEWCLSDHGGFTVAHQAARTNHLPPGFTDWDLSDCDGRTVAYEYALGKAERKAAENVPWDVEPPTL